MSTKSTDNNSQPTGRPPREDGVIGAIRSAISNLRDAGMPLPDGDALTRLEKRHLDMFRRSRVFRERGFVVHSQGEVNAGPSLTVRFVENLIILREVFLFKKADFEKLLEENDRTDRFARLLRSSYEAVTLLAHTGRFALTYEQPVRRAFEQCGNLEEVQLRLVFTSPVSVFEHEVLRARATTHELQMLEELMARDDYQDGEPNALAGVAARYQEMGAVTMASALLEQALEADPEHLWSTLLQAKLHIAAIRTGRRQAFTHDILASETYEGSAEGMMHRQNLEDQLEAVHNAQSRLFSLCVKIFERVVYALDHGVDDFDSYRVALDLEKTVTATLLFGSLSRDEDARGAQYRAAKRLMKRWPDFFAGSELACRLVLSMIQVLRRMEDPEYRSAAEKLVEDIRTSPFPEHYSSLFRYLGGSHRSDGIIFDWLDICEDVIGVEATEMLVETFQGKQVKGLTRVHQLQRRNLVIRRITERSRDYSFIAAFDVACQAYEEERELFVDPPLRDIGGELLKAHVDLLTYLLVSTGLAAIERGEDGAERVLEHEAMSTDNLRASAELYDGNLDRTDWVSSNMHPDLAFSQVWWDHDFWERFDGDRGALFAYLRRA